MYASTNTSDCARAGSKQKHSSLRRIEVQGPDLAVRSMSLGGSPNLRNAHSFQMPAGAAGCAKVRATCCNPHALPLYGLFICILTAATSMQVASYGAKTTFTAQKLRPWYNNCVPCRAQVPALCADPSQSSVATQSKQPAGVPAVLSAAGASPKRPEAYLHIPQLLLHLFVGGQRRLHGLVLCPPLLFTDLRACKAHVLKPKWSTPNGPHPLANVKNRWGSNGA